MTKKYVQIRIPVKIHKHLLNKKLSMQEELKKVTGKKKVISYGKIINLSLSKPLYLNGSELQELSKK